MQHISTVMGRIVEGAAILASPANTDTAHFWAEGRVIKSAAGIDRTPPEARDMLHTLADLAVSATSEGVSNRWASLLPDLIAAIRDAERNDPLPPASMARAA
jgi:hypothetical protein